MSCAKKSRMRTAEDVIKRLEWDVLDHAVHGFSVGYLDRFLGIMEEPFESRDGMWREVPQHRIAWFKYGGTVIWEKESRTDYVFGTANGRGKRLPAVVAEVNAALDNDEEAGAAGGCPEPAAEDPCAPCAAASRARASSAADEVRSCASSTPTLDTARVPSAGAAAAAAYAEADAEPDSEAESAAGGDSFEWTDTSWADDSWA